MSIQFQLYKMNGFWRVLGNTVLSIDSNVCGGGLKPLRRIRVYSAHSSRLESVIRGKSSHHMTRERETHREKHTERNAYHSAHFYFSYSEIQMEEMELPTFRQLII